MKEKEIILKNFKLDLIYLYKANFVDSRKGYILLLSLITLKFISKKPNLNYIKNNSFISLKAIQQNRIIKVKPLEYKSYCDVNDVEYNNNDKEINQNKINPIIKCKHVPSLNYLMDKLNSNNRFKREKNESVNEEFLQLKLAGIEYISKEGKQFINNILTNKHYSLYAHFHDANVREINNIYNINNNDNIINVWILYKKKLLPFSKFQNLNILISKNGLSKVDTHKIEAENIYDEKLYFYYYDLILADKNAKAKGLGIYRNSRSTIIAESYVWTGLVSYIINKFNKRFNNKRWEKIILRKQLNN